ncbi:TetR/AcrR family transcriptional regulator [Nocardia bovistercoris]|uniref:TetR/AcrR family transcriptional regulator n=1 Tax=Nocardia bovistercoris TaxID=2785916 RepID=A0A931MZC7_9NOCA|nr:TetR/AcrR family transcriptional regulator [Nocardia bovistercoris]MBH0776000.1 TetR/AcrR family transcriptional regulator [Nocardia bovistercoris]
MTAGPRERLIDGAIDLVREHGVHGAGLAALLDRSRASRNSLYQHFPFGKGELVEAATVVAGERMSAVIAKVTATGEPAQWLSALTGWWRIGLEASGYRAGCPIVGAALAESEPAVQAAAAAAFADWTRRLAHALAGTGMPVERAESLAGFVVSALEGAIIQSRALKSTRPLDDLETTLAPLLRESNRREHPAGSRSDG